jgi:hypothetical protein
MASAGPRHGEVSGDAVTMHPLAPIRAISPAITGSSGQYAEWCGGRPQVTGWGRGDSRAGRAAILESAAFQPPRAEYLVHDVRRETNGLKALKWVGAVLPQNGHIMLSPVLRHGEITRLLDTALYRSVAPITVHLSISTR